jgi:protocatechuate 3,4-dioxygenase beta subunit
MRKMFLMLMATLIASTIGISVMAQTHTFAPGASNRLIEITGRIRDTQGHPVAALKISLRNWFGFDLGSAVTDENGVFDLRNVAPGRYHCNFRPLAENSLGQTVILDVPAHFMHMNLTVNRNPSAMARAQDTIVRLS